MAGVHLFLGQVVLDVLDPILNALSKCIDYCCAIFDILRATLHISSWLLFKTVGRAEDSWLMTAL